MTQQNGTDGDFTGVNIINKNLFGSRLFAFACPISDTSSAISFAENNLKLFLTDVNNKSKIESIQAIFIVPGAIIENSVLTTKTGQVGLAHYTFYEIGGTFSPLVLTNTIQRITSFSDFTPKNRKVFCLPL